MGSPPRMRGKVLRNKDIKDRDGITPAYAGKSSKGGKQYGPAQDHPRVCGEKFAKTRELTRRKGSPPRMRGKAVRFDRCCCSRGITPAYAGKSRRSSQQESARWDHPRVCGEKKRFIILHTSFQGSPPRMRGKGEALDCELEGLRITPAYAGKRLNRSHTSVLFTCHLRPVHSVSHRLSE